MVRDELNKALTRRTRNVVVLQMVIAVLVALIFFATRGAESAKAALYGGFVNIFIAMLLGRGVARAGNAAAHDVRRGMFILVIGVIQRFLLVLLLFGVGFKLLGLDPLPAIVAFGLTQLGYLISVRESAK